MKFKPGDRVKYVGRYPDLDEKIGTVVKVVKITLEVTEEDTSYNEYLIDFKESGFTFGHNGDEDSPDKNSCWYVYEYEIELVERKKTMIYYKKEEVVQNA